MLFNSIDFLVFFPIVLLVYYIIPQKIKNIWLLVASYYFYMSWNAKYALLIAFTTVVTYVCGLVLSRINEKKTHDIVSKKLCVAAAAVINLGLLCLFKYSNFFLDNLGRILSRVGIGMIEKRLDLLLPVGISFYTFQALGYVIDVYRGTVKSEKNFLRYALFVSFFPQLVAGPIERSQNLLKQINERHYFEPENVRDGAFLMLWGYFLKLVMGDRIAVFVDAVFNDIPSAEGVTIAVAAILFAIQIYCDFAGYSTIAMGAARMLGFTLTDNFNAPYLATSVEDFWRRWHITLTGWFRDYLYIPLGGNRKGKLRKYINIMIVFLLSGLWHGASWSFVLWGGLNGLYQVIGALFMPLRDRIAEAFKIKREAFIHRIWCIVTTFIAVDFAWIFFRANSAKEALVAIRMLFATWDFSAFKDGRIFDLGFDGKDFIVVFVGMILITVSDILKNKGLTVRGVIAEKKAWFGMAVTVLSVCFIVVFGIWGSGYDAAAFIYFQF